MARYVSAETSARLWLQHGYEMDMTENEGISVEEAASEQHIWIEVDWGYSDRCSTREGKNVTKLLRLTQKQPCPKQCYDHKATTSTDGQKILCKKCRGTGKRVFSWTSQCTPPPSLLSRATFQQQSQHGKHAPSFVSFVCSQCAGSGEAPTTCGVCHGTRYLDHFFTFPLSISPCQKVGDTLCLKEKGDWSFLTKRWGNVFVILTAPKRDTFCHVWKDRLLNSQESQESKESKECTVSELEVLSDHDLWIELLFPLSWVNHPASKPLCLTLPDGKPLTLDVSKKPRFWENSSSSSSSSLKHKAAFCFQNRGLYYTINQVPARGHCYIAFKPNLESLYQAKSEVEE